LSFLLNMIFFNSLKGSWSGKNNNYEPESRSESKASKLPIHTCSVFRSTRFFHFSSLTEKKPSFPVAVVLILNRHSTSLRKVKITTNSSDIKNVAPSRVTLARLHSTCVKVHLAFIYHSAHLTVISIFSVTKNFNFWKSAAFSIGTRQVAIFHREMNFPRNVKEPYEWRKDEFSHSSVFARGWKKVEIKPAWVNRSSAKENDLQEEFLLSLVFCFLIFFSSLVVGEEAFEGGDNLSLLTTRNILLDCSSNI
jgi:hypothetical protein